MPTKGAGTAERRLLALVGRPFPSSSIFGKVFARLLDESRPITPREQWMRADITSFIYGCTASLTALIAPVLGPLNKHYGHTVAAWVGAFLFGPTGFFITLMFAVQVAKFRERFDGNQPILGKGSWLACWTVAAATFALVLVGVSRNA